MQYLYMAELVLHRYRGEHRLAQTYLQRANRCFGFGSVKRDKKSRRDKFISPANNRSGFQTEENAFNIGFRYYLARARCFDR